MRDQGASFKDRAPVYVPCVCGHPSHDHAGVNKDRAWKRRCGYSDCPCRDYLPSPAGAVMTEDQREIRKLRLALKNLTRDVTAHIRALDTTMELPATPQLATEIAGLSNALEMANDLALHFGLGIDVPLGERR